MAYIVTEAGDKIITEDGNYLVTEDHVSAVEGGIKSINGLT